MTRVRASATITSSAGTLAAWAPARTKSTINAAPSAALMARTVRWAIANSRAAAAAPGRSMTLVSGSVAGVAGRSSVGSVFSVSSMRLQSFTHSFRPNRAGRNSSPVC